MNIPPGGLSGALNGERFSRFGVLGREVGRRRLRRRRLRVMASHVNVAKNRAA
jgi:hypothetical protein